MHCCRDMLTKVLIIYWICCELHNKLYIRALRKINQLVESAALRVDYFRTVDVVDISINVENQTGFSFINHVLVIISFNFGFCLVSYHRKALLAILGKAIQDE